MDILERPRTFYKPFIAIVKNVVTLGDFDEAEAMLFSDLHSIHLKWSVAITEERRLLSLRKKGSLEIALFSMKVHLLKVGIFMHKS